MIPRAKLILAVLAVSFISLGCVWFPTEYTVAPSFTVHVSNRFGPVAGLKLRANRPKDADLSGLIPEELRARLTNEKVERVEESITDANGDAHFDLDRPGHWYLEPYNPARNLDVVSVFADPTFKATTVDLQWPRNYIETRHLQGRITAGLTLLHKVPLKQSVVGLYDYISLKELTKTKTGDDGSFQFDGIATGIYFLGLNTTDGTTPNWDNHYLQGYVPVYIGPDGQRDWLSILAENTDCGLSYDLEENNKR
jgi:hypothetical protein